jgi:hypothetical protein
MLVSSVILKRAHASRAVRPLALGRVWASDHNGDIKRTAYGYEPTRDDAMAAFARSWHRET